MSKKAEVRSYFEVSPNDLPVSCPINPNQMTHPRVYIEIDQKNTGRCPYCGAQFLVKNPA